MPCAKTDSAAFSVRSSAPSGKTMVFLSAFALAIMVFRNSDMLLPSDCTPRRSNTIGR